ncbi:hypothetical protein [Rhizobium bangladeshense]|uniref:hypothetical protein n=1 Tax=Rhizobium bangladeshense TaxID=1138189 RepID=UPI002180B171|nr:hypothetical protein [Rhizobium bangladeshense]
MTARHILAIDLAKRSFQVCATDRGGAVLCNRVLSRARLQQFLSEQSPCIVAMEACATSRFWGRFAQNCGHDVRLILATLALTSASRGETVASLTGPTVA